MGKKFSYALKALSEPNTMVVFVLAMTLAFSIISLIPFSIFNANEPAPNIHRFVPDRTSQFGEQLQEVKTGFYVDDFPGFDMISNSFSIEGIVWFQFDDANLSRESIGNFSFIGGTTTKEKIDETIVGNELLVQYKVRVDFTSALDHRRFPYADHRIFLVMTNSIFTSKDLLFEARNSGFTTSIDAIPDSWTLARKYATSGYSIIKKTEHDLHARSPSPMVIYAFEFEKPGFRQAMTLILPLFLIYLVGVFAMAIKSEEDSATSLELAIGSLSGLVAYRFVVEQVSPKVGYLLLSDYIHLIFFIAAFIIFLHCAYAHALMTRAASSEQEVNPHYGEITLLHIQELVIFYGIQIAVIIATFFVVFYLPVGE